MPLPVRVQADKPRNLLQRHGATPPTGNNLHNTGH